MSLQQRVAVVTGGTRGIGKGIAVALGRAGARLVVAYRSNKAAAQNTLLDQGRNLFNQIPGGVLPGSRMES